MDSIKEIVTNENQNLIFTIHYDENHPIAVEDFTKALVGLNHFYSSYVRQKLIENGEIKYYQRKEREDIGKFYIEKIKPCCISCILTDPNFWSIGIGFVGMIFGVLSYLQGRKKSDESHNEHESCGSTDINVGGNNSGNINVDNSVKINITDMSHFMDIINPLTSDDRYLTIEVPEKKQEVTIKHEDKLKSDREWNLLKSRLGHYSYRHKRPGQLFNAVWVEIKKNKSDRGKYYATPICDPLLPAMSLPVSISDKDFLEELRRLAKQGRLNDMVFCVDLLVVCGDSYVDKIVKYNVINVVDGMDVNRFFELSQHQ